MIQVEFRQEGSYRVQMDTPERNVLRAIAFSFSISQEDAVVAILNRGMDSIGKQIKDTAFKDEESHGCPHSG